jgi:hypothetical protein
MPLPVENHAAARLWTERVARRSFRWLFLFQLIQGRVVWLATRSSREGVYDNEINTNNPVTTEIITQFGIKFLTNKNLENHPLY